MIAYLTHDEVNAADALRAARVLGLELIAVAVKDVAEVIAADALLLDLDNLPVECRSKLLRDAADGRLRDGVAVHSYRLSIAETRTLRSAGVRVARHMNADLLAPAVTVATRSAA